MPLSKKQLALVHIAKTNLALTDAEYRDLLAEFGAKSASNIDDKGFDKLLQRFRAMGFRPKFRPRPDNNEAEFPAGKERQLQKIKAQLIELGVGWKYADGIAARMFARPRVRWLAPEQLTAVIASLEYRLKKAEGLRLKAEDNKTEEALLPDLQPSALSLQPNLQEGTL